jgi:asparaginyl-tRNA synthetase
MTASSSVVILSGTKEALGCYGISKIASVAAITFTSLKINEVSAENLAAMTPLGSAAKLALIFSSSENHIGGSSVSTLIRVFASMSPASGLSGHSPVEQAQVDGWLSFVDNSSEASLRALEKLGFESTESKSLVEDVQATLATLDAHLKNRSFLVGGGTTIADIALLCVLQHATSCKELEGLNMSSTLVPTSEDDKPSPAPKYPNVSRYYDAMLHLPFVSTARQIVQSSTNVYHPVPEGGTILNGSAPPVAPKLYRRHRIRIKELLSEYTSHLNTTVTVAGWVRTTRNANKGELLFIELSDGSCGSSVQCVLERSVIANFDECKGCGGAGASFQVEGKVISSQGDGQIIEVAALSVTLLGAVYAKNAEGTEIGADMYPIPKKNVTLEHMRANAHLRARTKVHAAAMRIRHAMAYATHRFFNDNGFVYVHTPIVTAADCEGAGEQFGVTTLLGSDHLKPDVTLPFYPEPEPEDESKSSKKKKKGKKGPAKDPNKPEDIKVPGAIDYSTDFFGKRANLTVSGQLNVETHCCALSDVYTFGPTFRAENSHTSRHLCEFWMIEPEIAFATLEDDINLAEDFLKYCVQYALEMCAEDLQFFDEVCPFGERGLRTRLRNVIESPFKRLTYTEGIELLKKAVSDGHKFEEEVEWGMDLPSEMERYLCETIFKKPVVLTDYPKGIKAFYMKLNDDEKTVAAADILVPKIGEIIGGSQREHRREVLLERCIESGLDPKSIWWYMDLRKYGTIPHAGFGLGFERLMLFVTGLDNIRDVIPFPRWPGNSDF